ncbi:MAG TPA: TlyA family RNA methyltransferase [Syntrophorhabdaceae bacterium]|nr:TlyA family RNA methyltransferase [Syntrophorhabdaceae bacterium]
MAKERVDIVLARRGLAPSREKARILVMAGEVYLGSERVTKPDMKVEESAPLTIGHNPLPYVSYGGIKLKKAIEAFGLDVRAKKAIDIGSSTGGFTDCLLMAGASFVYAIDAGTHQLHEKLRNDPRVLLRENCNARHLTFEDIGEKTDLITIDVSFISLTKILPAAIQFLKDGGRIISLVKPQFEVGRAEVGRGGIVRDMEKTTEAIERIKAFGKTLGLMPVAMVESPREKEKKNREYFILWELQKNLSR